MKILFLDQFSELGGAQQTLLDTVEAVRRKGWQAHVLLPGSGPLIERLQSLGASTSNLPSGPYHSGRKSVGDSIRFALDLRQQVRAIQTVRANYDFDLIYANGPRLFPAAALVSRGVAPLVFHAHSHVYGIAGQMLRAGIRSAKPFVIACSNSVLDPLGGCAETRSLRVIPNGVRDAGYRVRDFGRDGQWRIGIIGRVTPDKGQLEFASAAASLARDLPGARFVICGSLMLGASPAYFDAVRHQTRGLPVEYVDWQSDVGPVLRDLDLLVVPSRREGMARIIVEAFSAGVPVVAFPAGGIPEVIVDGNTGFLTREFSSDALAARIREVVASRETLAEVASNARQAWSRLYTVAAYQERVTQLLRQLLERPAASPPARQTAAPQPGKWRTPRPAPADSRIAQASSPKRPLRWLGKRTSPGN
jgi:glycosyltransferase involved in cell wall biosynthesis